MLEWIDIEIGNEETMVLSEVLKMNTTLTELNLERDRYLRQCNGMKWNENEMNRL